MSLEPKTCSLSLRAGVLSQRTLGAGSERAPSSLTGKGLLNTIPSGLCLSQLWNAVHLLGLRAPPRPSALSLSYGSITLYFCIPICLCIFCFHVLTHLWVSPHSFLSISFCDFSGFLPVSLGYSSLPLERPMRTEIFVCFDHCHISMPRTAHGT